MNRYQLIIFDWDGTLMDSTGHIVNCMRRAITKLELAPLADEEISHIIGLGLHEAVQTLYPAGNDVLWRSLADCYRQTWLSSPEETPLFENARELLTRLAEQDLFLGVATGKSRRGLDKVLKATGLGDHFIATRCADECHSKPHPQMLMELMAYTGVTPEQAIMIGDTEFDLMMASNAGAHGLGITHGAHDEAKLLACSPRAIVHDLYQVETWLHRTAKQF
ncbi:HAD-IA family hydrolase [Methylophaga sp. OBS1]|jgi:phosphoglycolate phosphatase|uniref:HAD-IA family hydrolase n=1 Tax=Methylophaga sp. OBS1 TaxID=2991933 RepID=UPI00224CB609|nr:HAD-IA family hydrolase [Methylophaga sp. OBS1]MCX4192988.1 HAD-IA family hydrolase [Methylophaga sp. OBS1]